MTAPIDTAALRAAAAAADDEQHGRGSVCLDKAVLLALLDAADKFDRLRTCAADFIAVVGAAEANAASDLRWWAQAFREATKEKP